VHATPPPTVHLIDTLALNRVLVNESERANHCAWWVCLLRAEAIAAPCVGAALGHDAPTASNHTTHQRVQIHQNVTSPPPSAASCDTPPCPRARAEWGCPATAHPSTASPVSHCLPPQRRDMLPAL